MPQPNQEILKRAIEEYQKAYDDLHKQLLVKLAEADELKISLGKLEAFLNPAKALLSSSVEPETKAILPSPPPPPPKSLIHVPPIILEEKPILQGGIEILKDTGRPMYLSEIEAEFRKRRWKLSEKNGREVLRFTFSKKIGTVFRKSKKWLYELIDQSGQTPPPQPILRRAYPPPQNTSKDQ